MEWKKIQGMWRHSGRLGAEPEPPIWPTCLPEYRESLSAIRAVEGIGFYLRLAFREDQEFDLDMAKMAAAHLGSLLDCLDDFERLLEAPEADESDGPIDRNQLASLLAIAPKTLANRSSELPEPIARTSRNVPIYLYLAARHALLDMYPDRAYLLPSYKDALAKLP